MWMIHDTLVWRIASRVRDYSVDINSQYWECVGDVWRRFRNAVDVS